MYAVHLHWSLSKKEAFWNWISDCATESKNISSLRHIKGKWSNWGVAISHTLDMLHPKFWTLKFWYNHYSVGLMGICLWMRKPDEMRFEGTCVPAPT